MVKLQFSKHDSTGHSERKQKNRWEDNIKKWTGIDFASSPRAAETRTLQKEITSQTD